MRVVLPGANGDGVARFPAVAVGSGLNELHLEPEELDFSGGGLGGTDSINKGYSSEDFDEHWGAV